MDQKFALVTPAVRLVADAGKTGGIDPDLLKPDVGRFVVLGVDRHPEPFGGQAGDLGQKLPGVADGVALEVVAEAEVAEHLEEGVVAGGVTHILQIVVLAAGAHTALGTGGATVGALLAPEKNLFELDHARIGEQQGRVVEGHQWTARHHLVAVAGEIVQEGLANISATLHFLNLKSSVGQGKVCVCGGVGQRLHGWRR